MTPDEIADALGFPGQGDAFEGYDNYRLEGDQIELHVAGGGPDDWQGLDLTVNRDTTGPFEPTVPPPPPGWLIPWPPMTEGPAPNFEQVIDQNRIQKAVNDAEKNGWRFNRSLGTYVRIPEEEKAPAAGTHATKQEAEAFIQAQGLQGHIVVEKDIEGIHGLSRQLEPCGLQSLKTPHLTL